MKLKDEVVIKRPELCEHCVCYADDSDYGPMCMEHKLRAGWPDEKVKTPQDALRLGFDVCLFVVEA